MGFGAAARLLQMMFFMGPVHEVRRPCFEFDSLVCFLPGREHIFGACFVWWAPDESLERINRLKPVPIGSG